MSDMKRRTLKPKQPWISKCVLSLVIAVGFTGTSFAAQFDAPYYEFLKKHGDEWAKEDKAIDAKLAALEKKFGKKPNIIYMGLRGFVWMKSSNKLMHYPAIVVDSPIL